MLLKSRISQIGMYEGDNVNEQWRQIRLSMFTSSQIYKICAEKGFGEGGMNYIRSRVFESIARIPSDPEVNTESTIHGLVEEGAAIKGQIAKMGINPRQVVVQKFIYGNSPMYGGTPDAIYCINESSDGLSWNVEVWEAKCYEVLKHMESLEISNAQELKIANRPLYFQILDNMLNVDCLTGKVIFRHPAMPEENGGHHVVEIRKMQQLKDSKGEIVKDLKGNPIYPIVNDLSFLNERKALAEKEFHRIRNKLLNIKN